MKINAYRGKWERLLFTTEDCIRRNTGDYADCEAFTVSKGNFTFVFWQEDTTQLCYEIHFGRRDCVKNAKARPVDAGYLSIPEPLDFLFHYMNLLTVYNMDYEKKIQRIRKELNS